MAFASCGSITRKVPESQDFAARFARFPGLGFFARFPFGTPPFAVIVAISFHARASWFSVFIPASFGAFPFLMAASLVFGALACFGQFPLHAFQRFVNSLLSTLHVVVQIVGVETAAIAESKERAHFADFPLAEFHGGGLLGSTAHEGHIHIGANAGVANEDGELILINQDLVVDLGKDVVGLQHFRRRAVCVDVMDDQPDSTIDAELSPQAFVNGAGCDSEERLFLRLMIRFVKMGTASLLGKAHAGGEDEAGENKWGFGHADSGFGVWKTV
tara:strand:- start:10972 stop:11790 length:819 start_codon:yes stop_codon:yes gene_type:complete